MSSILLISENNIVALDLNKFFKQNGYKIIGPIKSPAKLYSNISVYDPDVIIIDLSLLRIHDSTAYTAFFTKCGLMNKPIVLLNTNPICRKLLDNFRFNKIRLLDEPFAHDDLLLLLEWFDELLLKTNPRDSLSS